MKTQDQIKSEFFAYLDSKFGSVLSGLIKPPNGVKIGERVLYRLMDGFDAQRADVAQVNREIQESFTQLASQLSEKIDGLDHYTEPIISSGLPYPRTIDIPPASDLVLGSLATRYTTNHDELPEKDFPILWLFGVVFGYSAKYLLYLDFTHPKLRAIYVAEYDVEYEPSTGKDIHDKLKTFIGRQAEMKNMVNDRPEVRWVKVVQTDSVMWTTIKTDNNLIQEQVTG